MSGHTFYLAALENSVNLAEVPVNVVSSDDSNVTDTAPDCDFTVNLQWSANQSSDDDWDGVKYLTGATNIPEGWAKWSEITIDQYGTRAFNNDTFDDTLFNHDSNSNTSSKNIGDVTEYDGTKTDVAYIMAASTLTTSANSDISSRSAIPLVTKDLGAMVNTDDATLGDELLRIIMSTFILGREVTSSDPWTANYDPLERNTFINNYDTIVESVFKDAEGTIRTFLTTNTGSSLKQSLEAEILSSTDSNLSSRIDDIVAEEVDTNDNSYVYNLLRAGDHLQFKLSVNFTGAIIPFSSPDDTSAAVTPQSRTFLIDIELVSA